MWFYKECALFTGTFIGMFFAGAVHPVLGWLTLAVLLFLVVPRFWRASTIWHTERQVERKRQNIETQMMRGALDARLIREVAEDMKRDGRL